jgi:hypothetical protein
MAERLLKGATLWMIHRPFATLEYETPNASKQVFEEMMSVE